jgi:hypothetical protein
MPSLPKFNSNTINKTSSQSTNISESENHVQNNIPGIQSGEGQEIDIGGRGRTSSKSFTSSIT